MRPIILIPARMASTRLPGKPLHDIAGLPMIVQVWKRAMESNMGRVAVACDGEEIAAAIRAAGGEAVLTDPELPSGSDRIHAALEWLDPEKQHDVIVNLQGDLPTLDPKLVADVLRPLEDSSMDIGTLAVEMNEEKDAEDISNPSIVKIALALAAGQPVGRALYFSRNVTPYGPGPFYHHIGIYAYRRAALERFVALPVGVLEAREKLEQLRALENGMAIGVRVVDTAPLGVDTPAQLEEARRILTKGQI